MCSECPRQLARDRDGAFADFVRHHQDLAYGICRRLVSTEADAQDLAQEAFVRAYRALLTWDAKRIRGLRTRGWVAAICLNLARDRARARAARPPLASLDAALEAAGPGRLDDAPTRRRRSAEPADDAAREPHAVAVRRESAREWRARLDALPPTARRAVELRHVEGLSYAEMAEALGRPVNTVKSDVHRGVALLRAAWLAAEGHAGEIEEVTA